MPATPVIVPKASTVSPKNPDTLASNATAGHAGAGITFAARRYGYGTPVAALSLQSAKPMFGVAGAEGIGAQSADAGANTVFPSQFCFPTSKYHNSARTKGMV